MPPPVGGSSRGCPAVWRISHHRVYCSRESTVRPPHPCGSSFRSPAAWQATPSWAVCRHACHQLLPWLRATFAIVSDAAWPGSDQRPCSTAPATGPVSWLGRPSASHPGGVDRGVLSLCCPRCMCVCGVLAHVARVHRCARCVRCACAVGGCVPLPPPPNFLFCSFFFLLCICLAFLFSFVLSKIEKGARAHCRHRHGQLVQWCNSIVFSGVCRCCFGGGRAPGVWLGRLDVHGHGSGWDWLVASLLLVLAG